jgi:hypothetical protein
LLLPVRSPPPTVEHSATLHRTVSSRVKGKPVQLTWCPKVRNWARRTKCVAYGFVFLAIIRCNLLFICLVDGICGLHRLAYYVVLFVSLLFLLPFPSFWPARTRSLGSPAPAPHHKPPSNCSYFFLDGGQRFHPRGR